MTLEDELRNALRREDPPEGFAERVIRQAGPDVARFRPAPQRKSTWTWAAVAAVAAALLLMVSLEYRHAQEKRAAEEAVQALQIVAEELNMVQNEVLTK